MTIAVPMIGYRRHATEHVVGQSRCESHQPLQRVARRMGSPLAKPIMLPTRNCDGFRCPLLEVMVAYRRGTVRHFTVWGGGAPSGGSRRFCGGGKLEGRYQPTRQRGADKQ